MEKLLLGEHRALIIPQAEADREIDYNDDNMKLINLHTQKELTRNDVFIRSMWLCNDIIDSYFSRFNGKTLQVLSEKIVGQSVLIGHRKDSLPIGRFFKAAKVTREDGHEWLRAWFYWPKDMDKVGDFHLSRGIETGLYREVSISWGYKKAICSICGQDIRSCEHIPGKEYAIEGKVRLCWYETDDITDVYEGSFVYKGGQHGTFIANESRKEMATERDKILRKFTADKTAEKRQEFFKFVKPLKPEKGATISNEYFDLSTFPKDLLKEGEFYVEPKYDGIRVQVHKSGDKVAVYTSTGKEIQERLPLIVEELKKNEIDNVILDGELIKKRGHSRLCHRDVVQYLNSDDKRDYSLYIKLFDVMRLGEEPCTNEPLSKRRHRLETHFPETPHITLVRYTRVAGRQLLNAMKVNSSKEGCMVKELSSTYTEPSKIWKWKRIAEVDVVVIEAKEVAGGFVYECGFGSTESPQSLGSTFVTKIEAEAGNILQVRVAFIDKTDDGYRWYEPSVVDLREDKDEPDQLATIEKLLRDKQKSRIAGQEVEEREVDEDLLWKMVDEDRDEEVSEEGRAVWTTKYKNELPDSAFCPSLIKTVFVNGKKKKMRKCPHHDHAGKVDKAHVTAGLKLVSKVQGFSAAAKAAARSHLLKHSNAAKKGRAYGGESEDRVKWTRKYINSLPNSAFAAVEQPYTSGKCKDKNARHLPHHDHTGKVDLAHLRNALVRVNQIKPVCKGVSKEALVAKARKHLEGHRSLLKGKKCFELYRAWIGKNVFHQLYLDDGSWFTLPAVINNSMICKKNESLSEYCKTRKIDEGDCEVLADGATQKTVSFDSVVLKGEYRFQQVKLKSSFFWLVDNTSRGTERKPG